MSQHFDKVDVAKLKVAELKDELEKRGLETTGLKADLAERLRKAQDLSLSGGTELAMPSDELKDSAQPLGPASPPLPMKDDPSTHERPPTPPLHEAADPELGVGHVMVENAGKALREPQTAPAMDTVAERAELEPAALDEEVAKVVAEEEVRAERPPTPELPRAVSPIPTPTRLDTKAPAGDAEMLGDEDDMTMDLGDEAPAASLPSAQPTGLSSSKRQAEGEESVDRSAPTTAPKRPRRTYNTPLPPALSHLLHPPTSILYITNLRRPLLLSSLHEYIFPISATSTTSSHGAASSDLLPPPRPPFASTDHPGLWLSGIKSHAYAAFASLKDATAAAERIEGVHWPADGEGEGKDAAGQSSELRVQFVPDERVEELVRQEEEAWGRGRQKLELKIRRTTAEHAKGSDEARPSEEEWEFELVPAGGLGSGPARTSGGQGRGGRVGAPAGPSMRGRTPIAPPLTGSNGLRAPGSGMGFGSGSGRQEPRYRELLVRGGRDEGRWPGPDRVRGPMYEGDGRGRIHDARESGRMDKPYERTDARPALAFREGPRGDRR